MVDRPLTEAQRDAVVASGSVAVRAGAGSGKTTVLAERFVQLLRPTLGADRVPEVRRLLAITFTERAAAEMRGRIRALIERESRRRPDEAAHWATVQRDLLGAHISTIHAFCARLVREFPIESGVDPDARVLDADEARRYLDARVQRHLLARASRGDVGAMTLLRRARGVRGGRGGGAVGTMLGMLESLGRLGRGGAWLCERTRHARSMRGQDDVAALSGELITLVDAKLDGRRSAKREAFANAWPRLREAVRALGESPVNDVGAATETLAELVTALKQARMASEVAPIVSQSEGRLRGSLIEALASVVLKVDSLALAELVAEIEALLREDKRRDALLTFDDLVSGARDLVVGDAGVRAQLARRFDAVLLDESQDTDAAQAELLRSLTKEGGPDLFVVGDEKQAIYGFRGADVGVFEGLLEELPKRVTLGHNFRSVPGILAFVNAMAAEMLRAPAEASYPSLWTRYGPEHALVAHRVAEGAEPPVRIVTAAHELIRRGKPNAAGRRELEARVLAEVLVDLLSAPAPAVRAGDVTVLLRSLREVKVYERALARRGVPYHVVGGRGFFQRQEVRDVVSLAALVADAGDDVALAAVLRSPWVGLGDDELAEMAVAAGSLRRGFRENQADDEGPLQVFTRRLAALRAMRSRATVSEIIVRAVETADLEAVLLALPQGVQLVANVRKVIELARAFERGPHGGIAEFVAWMRRREAADADEPEAILASEEGDVVRLMTIHQAKGLEFPIVILADLGREPRIDYDAVAIDGERGVIAAPLVGAGGHALVPAELAAHRARALEASRAEHARLFYVACTRARDRLILLDVTTPPDRLEGRSVSRETWGHALWSLVGDAQVLEAGAASAPTSASLGSGVVVRIDPASVWLGVRPLTLGNTAAAPAITDGELQARVAAIGTPGDRGRAVVECTPTDLAVFRACPRRWWYQSVLGVREGSDGGRRARVLGNVVHGAIERWTAGVATTADDALGPSFAFRVTNARLRDEVRTDVGRAIAWLAAEQRVRLLARELGIVMALAPDVVLRGRIDAVLERDGQVVVRDYKYARLPARLDPIYADQLALYTLALARAGTAAQAAELLYLRPEPTIMTVPIPPLERVTETMLDAARRMADWRSGERSEPPERRPVDSDACREAGCGYVRRCWISGTDQGVLARRDEA